ncbi:hypothetical protein LB456_09000 [Psychroflexus sp. CAK57W]|uniref:hypothetical protein n=1 Tax=Psychroflexus curvus TaxID=2873595 RepID=UPI001CCC9E17|nr:hypothetical protein [Psychroflexus curvus]MBZ9787591.1 hypothetical protein [Psychroflexus curvus]
MTKQKLIQNYKYNLGVVSLPERHAFIADLIPEIELHNLSVNWIINTNSVINPAYADKLGYLQKYIRDIEKEDKYKYKQEPIDYASKYFLRKYNYLIILDDYPLELRDYIRKAKLLFPQQVLTLKLNNYTDGNVFRIKDLISDIISFIDSESNKEVTFSDIDVYYSRSSNHNDCFNPKLIQIKAFLPCVIDQKIEAIYLEFNHKKEQISYIKSIEELGLKCSTTHLKALEENLVSIDVPEDFLDYYYLTDDEFTVKVKLIWEDSIINTYFKYIDEFNPVRTIKIKAFIVNANCYECDYFKRIKVGIIQEKSDEIISELYPFADLINKDILLLNEDYDTEKNTHIVAYLNNKGKFQSSSFYAAKIYTPKGVLYQTANICPNCQKYSLDFAVKENILFDK